ncbi:MAG: TolC family protein [Bacteroidales bacterium]|nr:TolC family protein [Bacteroidales bacterium]
MKRMNKILLSLAIISLSLNASAQSVNEFLYEVLENHPGVIAGQELLDSEEAYSKTGYTPKDPSVQAGYFPGKPETMGDKTTWSVNQSFDFPTHYRNIKRLKKNDYELAVMEYHYTVLALMEEARARTIQMTALQKHIERSSERLKHLQSREKAYRKMLDEGEITIIDYNKARITLAHQENILTEYKAEKEAVKAYLDMISGDNSAMIETAAYPLFEEPDYEYLLAEKREKHPAFSLAEKNIEIAESNISVIRSDKLPELTLGYASEIVAASRFTGPTVGLSLPLWENKGRLEAAKAKKSHYKAEYENSINVLENDLMSRYNKFLSVKSGLETLRSALPDKQVNILLNKALAEGEISVIEYFTELSQYYDTEDKIIELEKEYYLLLSELYNHFPGLIIPGI